MKLWGSINIANNVPASLPGTWHVKFYIKNTSGGWDLLSDKQFTILQDAYPTSPKLDVANNGTYEWTYSGSYQTSQTTPDFATELNSYLANNIGTQGLLQVPVSVSSTTTGQIKLDSLKLTYFILDTIPPTLESYLPPASVLKNHSFSVDATVNDNDVLDSVYCTFKGSKFPLINTMGNS